MASESRFGGGTHIFRFRPRQTIYCGADVRIARKLSPGTAALALACATAMQTVPGGLTSPGITAEDLRTRLYIFADDSMMGRQFGTEGNLKGTQYIADELARMGVQPGGVDGTYFQNVPAFRIAPVRSA